MPLDFAYAWEFKGTEPFVLSDEGLYRKQLIYVGSFVKDGHEITVDEAMIDHWVNEMSTYLSNGNEVPAPLEHTVDPAKNRGYYHRFEKGLDSKGRISLFGFIKFADSEAEKLKTRANVSIFVPPEWTDGKNNRYVRPIRHVAFTNYPVVPGLEGFEVVAASFVPKEEIEMSLRTLADALKIDGDDSRDDVAIERTVVSRFKSLQTTVAELKAQIKELKGKPATKKPEEPKKTEEPKPIAVAASHVDMLEENRVGKIEKLVTDGKITAAVADELKKQYVTKERLTLCLSQEGYDDGFNATIAALNMNEPVIKFSEESPGQALSDPSIYDASKNPLLADAAARAKAAGA